MISIIAPFFNEEQNLEPLVEEIRSTFEPLKKKYELVLVNDGSTDESAEKAKELDKKYTEVRYLSLRRRFGKGEALAQGIAASAGDIIVFMDADLQDNPTHIEEFLIKLDDGYDLVNGVRQKRQHNSVIKFYSNLGNKFLRAFTKSPFTDINCGFKAFKREVLDEIVLYANNFRFLPLAAFYRGYKVTEVPVVNRPRVHGVSKFGMGKAFVGLIDTITVYFLYQFAERPLHFFGTIGSLFFGVGSIVTTILLIQRVFFGILLFNRPLFHLGMFLVIVGIQIIMTGFIGELIVYFQKKSEKRNDR